MSSLIQVANLTKNYGSKRGVSDVSFAVDEGEVFGFLGPNGAGKTTTMRLLLGLLKPTSGHASIAGLDCWAKSTQVKRLLGYLPGEFSFDPGMTGAQILAYLGHLRGGVDQGYVRQLIERLDFDPSRRFREYSRGNKQKVGLVQAFMHRPRLLILDEPTSGLDPLNQQEFYKIVAETRQDGRTVFLSSHILPEVEHTCDRAAIIREGQLVHIDEVAGLKHLEQRQIDIRFADKADPVWFANIASVLNVSNGEEPELLRLNVKGEIRDVIKLAAEHGATNIAVHEPDLEEVFMSYYQRETVK
jgi:ABC-2 type transport system ATP-binding protein